MAKSVEQKKTKPSANKKYSPAKVPALNPDNPATAGGLHELLLDGIKDIYWAENHLVKAIPQMVKAASDKKLVATLTDHLAVTRNHVKRLEKVFEEMKEKKKAKKCDAMDGLSKEGEGVIEDTDAGTPARNLGIIMASQKVEHYEMAAYTGLSKLALKLGLSAVADLLTQNLNEEIAADESLAAVAETI
ncbi:MAG: DUF892 family protein [Ferruginibacter sp.]